AIRFDVGERSNFLLLPMMLAGLRQINEWGPGRIQEYCARLFEPALKELQPFGYQVEKAGGRFSHLVGIRLPDTLSPDRLRTALVDGSVHVSVRGTAIRVSPHVYNDARDVEALVDILKSAIHGS
ncbi:MAG: aminotransferase, partial [Rhodothermales bacterium]|nr:aminotransferase [Rhodothermales bacterium]